MLEKIKQFISKWWLVIALAILLILLGCGFACCIIAGKEHGAIGSMGIFGTFIAICYFTNMALKKYFDNKPPKGR